jgi:hypothetical protein
MSKSNGAQGQSLPAADSIPISYASPDGLV